MKPNLNRQASESALEITIATIIVGGIWASISMILSHINTYIALLICGLGYIISMTYIIKLALREYTAKSEE